MESYARLSQQPTDLHDYTTTHGNLQLLINRIQWKWVTLVVIGLGLVTLPFFVGGRKFSPEVANIDGSLTENLKAALSASPLSSGSEFQYIGPPGPLLAFTGYNEIASSQAGLTSITIRNALVDAPSLSSSIQQAYALQSITLENVSLLGKFSRVYLPQLKQFTYQQNKDDKRDSYKSPAALKETLFFEKIPVAIGSTWDVEKDLLNLGIILKISKAGTKLIEVNRPTGEIYLNVKYCHNVLKNVQGAISSLTLINCNTTEELSSIIPHNLKYLNLRNTIPSSAALERIIKPQTQLEEFHGYFNFHCDWPGWEVYLNVADLPPSTKKLGINNMDLSCTPGFKSSVTEFSIGDFINTQIVTEFDKIFVNVKKVGVFNITASYAYPLVQNILKTKADSISLIMFERLNENSTIESTNVTGVDQIVRSVEKMLNSSPNIGPMDEDIQILTKGKMRRVERLDGNEKHSLRYTGLGFDKMDTYEDYVLWDALQLANKSDKILYYNIKLLLLGSLTVGINLMSWHGLI